MFPGFMFATGIEGSYPTIEHGHVRMDEFEKCKHYQYWKTDFDLVEDMGIQFLRYGPPLHKTWLGHNKYDWEFADLTFNDLKRRGIIVIADLCHFGVPDWISNFQNPDFSELFAEYAEAFARRYPWVQLYTPVNEMSTCAKASALYGSWNEQETSDRSYVRAVKHIVKANVLAMYAILKARPDAIFIQSESSEYYHADGPDAIQPAEMLNARRFLPLDLNYGIRVNSDIYEYIMDNGMTREEYHFFQDQHLKHHCIMGTDYYDLNEHLVSPDGSTKNCGEIFGYEEITTQYYDRYVLPVMHTETNQLEGKAGDEAVYWLWKEWANVLRVRNNGVPIVGFTWYSLTDQVDWDTGLAENNGRVNPLGLYDLDRNQRKVGRAYKHLIESWKNVLPTSTRCMQVPVKPLSTTPLNGHDAALEEFEDIGRHRTYEHSHRQGRNIE